MLKDYSNLALPRRRRGRVRKLMQTDEFWSRIVVVGVLVGGVSLVFWQQLVGDAVFIGESDRLNSYLNMRLAEYDALRAYGRVPAWNPTMFAGFSAAALHWMNPGTDPISVFLQLFPRDRLFQVLGYVSIALVLAACTTAYFYIRDLTGARVSAAVAALCFGLSVFGLHRIAQVDNAYLTLVLLPASMLAIRRIRVDNLIRPFVGLTLSMAALAFWGFLQEVAYAFCFLAAYALYRAAVSRKCAPGAGRAVLIVFGTSSIVALLFAAPRLIAIGSELFQLARTSTFHYAGYDQLLRFFHEGIYGRYLAEGFRLGNVMNFHEGLQLLSSTAVVLFVCFGVARPSRWPELVAALLLFAMILAFRPIYRFTPPGGGLSLELVNVALFVCILSGLALMLRMSDRYLRFGMVLGRLLPATPRPTDTTFHLLALVVILFLILVLEGHYAVYLIFGRGDFTHARLSVLALLPLCSLFAIYLAELKIVPFGAAVARNASGRAAAIAFAIVLVAALVSWLIHGQLLDQLVPKTAWPVELYRPRGIVLPVAVKVALTAIVLVAVLAVFRWWPARIFDGRIAATIVVATFALVETVTYAHFKVGGPHTWTYPVPFVSGYMNVPPSAMRPPGEEALAALADKLQPEHFRSVLLTPPSLFRGAVTPHISQFWRARMIGGYGTGVPRRLGELPWPAGVRSLRMIELRSMSDINLELLSLLNVKFIVVATADLYFNTAGGSSDEGRAKPTAGDAGYPGEVVNVAGISFGLIRNSLAPLPRHFLVETVTGVEETPVLRGAVLEARTLSGRGDADASTTVREKIDRLTSHSLAENFTGSRAFDASGPFDVHYGADVIDIRMTPSERERFLVINERYHPDWRARVQTGDIPIVPANAVMLGIRIPAKADYIQLRFEPFSSTRTAHMLALLALLIFLAAVGVFRLSAGRLRHRVP